MYCSDENGILYSGESGWIDYLDSRCYRLENGQILTGWNEIEGVRYYLGDNGAVCNGWKLLDDNRYYLTDSVPAVGWTTIEGSRYYFFEDGRMATGWLDWDGKRYFFNFDGLLQTGWKTLDGNCYYFTSTGVMRTGWVTIDGNQYYFDENGVMQTNCEINGMYLDENGLVMSALLHTNKERAKAALEKYGTSVSGIYNYVQATNHHRYTEDTKTIEQLNSVGWLSLVDYAMQNYYCVCYYMAAKMDFVLREAGYQCRIVHATHGSGDHYWNQIYINGAWTNYDCTNGYANYSWNRIVAAGNYEFLGYVIPTYQ
jgi:hypothetical protein